MVSVSHPVGGKLIERSSGRVIPDATLQFTPERPDRLERVDDAIAYLADVQAVTDENGVVRDARTRVEGVELAATAGWAWRLDIRSPHISGGLSMRFYVTGTVDLATVPVITGAPPSGGGLSLVDLGDGTYEISGAGVVDHGDGTHSIGA